MQININGIHGKHEELLSYMELNKIHIAAIQETKYVKKSVPKNTPNYMLVRQDRGGKDTRGGGLALLIHKSIPFKRLKPPATLANDEHLSP